MRKYSLLKFGCQVPPCTLVCVKEAAWPWRGNELLPARRFSSSHPNSKCCFRGLCIIERTRESWEGGCWRIYCPVNKGQGTPFWKFPLGSRAICAEQPKQKPDGHTDLAVCFLLSSSFFQNPCPSAAAHCPSQHLWLAFVLAVNFLAPRDCPHFRVGTSSPSNCSISFPTKMR